MNFKQRIIIGIIMIASIVLGWLLRSSHIEGDGLMIVRITEHHRWLVNNELMGQVIVQLIYQIGQIFNLRAFEILQLTSIGFGTLALLIFCQGSKLHFGVPLTISSLIYLSTGYLLYNTGHTEYYPILLPWLFLYGFYGIAYLRGIKTFQYVVLVYFVGVSIHLAMLIVLPSLLLLPWLTKRFNDYRQFAWLAAGVGILIFFRDFSHLTGYQPVRLGSGWSVLPLFDYGGMKWRYAFFSWGHWLDWGYGLFRRSWLYLPLVISHIIIFRQRYRFVPEHLFLMCYTLCFTGWTLWWHPDLGIEADWDLFAIETAPLILLWFSCLNGWHGQCLQRYFIVTLATFGLLYQLSIAFDRVEAPQQGYGSIVIETVGNRELSFTILGESYPLEIPRIRAGRYAAKLIDPTQGLVFDLHIVVGSGETTTIHYQQLFTGPHLE